MTEEVKTKIKAFIARSFQNHDLQEEEDIFAMGFVNSLFAMQLVLFIEQEIGIAIENEDLEIENFSTINAITRLIERKTASRSQDKL